ncbi:hypothetical protein BH10PAT1_BH10PAT1_4390 [soil metagenome]
MLLILKNKVDDATLKKVGEDLDGYVKFVVDIEREILTAGGIRHFMGEELLLKDGSRQKDLWGGGLDLETSGIDFDSMINIRPNQGNTSRELLDKDLRKKVEEIVKKILV